MFSKSQFFIGVAIAAFIGIGIGYSKAREVCLEAVIKAMPSKNDENETDQTSE